ncbi:hypothetical protein CDD81_6441 [Ophiocordyceps australis]|uniref:Swiss Army Knife protein DSP-PTPase phosphatase domain-containing protein n=1 Tax=Ophiocordyceps australis TaxID=1399860 RepID=A0A2C5YHZ4_9HYPO|nr:hypothetical protein CDD81_6441 [Ophiocordyceps australis]
MPPPHPCAYAAGSIERLYGHGFTRFKFITSSHLHAGDRLARSSAPHYDCKDSSQELTPESIEYLQHYGIKHIISLNEFADNPGIKQILKANKISYTPIPTPDFAVPSLADLYKGYKSFAQTTDGATLVWCGFGHGRTGLMITAINLFREAEKLNPGPLTPDYVKTSHVETQAQFKALTKLQDILGPESFEDIYDEAMDVWTKAREAFTGIDLTLSQTQKEKEKAKTAAQDMLSSSVQALQDASVALESHWQICRVLFDRLLQGVARLKAQNIAADPEMMKQLEHIMYMVKWELHNPGQLAPISLQSTIVEKTLRSAVKSLEAPIATDQLVVTPLLLEEQIGQIEEYRGLIKDLYQKLRETVKEHHDDAERMLSEVPNTKALTRLQEIVHLAKGRVAELKTRALAAEDVSVISQCIEETVSGLSEAKRATNALAHAIRFSGGQTTVNFREVRQKLNDMRKNVASMLAHESRQFIKTQLIEKWQYEEEFTQLRKTADEKAKDLSDLGLRSYVRAAYLGEWLKEKATSLNAIKNFLQHPKLSNYNFDVELVLKTSMITWFRGREDLQDALEDERKTIEAEIDITQRSIQAYVTASLMVQKEAAIVSAALDQHVHWHRAGIEMMDWQGQSISQLLDTLQSQVEQEVELGRARKTKELEAAEASEKALQSEEWATALGIEIALAVAAAVPSPAWPVATALLWARQGIRATRYLRNAIRLGKIPVQLAAQARTAVQRLDKTLASWKTKVPQLFREWASEKSPQQVLDGIGMMHEEFGGSQLSLTNTGRQGVQVPSQEAAAAAANEEAAPAASRESSAKNMLEKSINELMQDLEDIHAPLEEPADKELVVPITETLRKLERIKVPKTKPGGSLPLVDTIQGTSRVRRPVAEIRHDLQEAASIPHHTSDVQFLKLLEDAAYYLPNDFDINPHSMCGQVIEAIR